MKTAPSSSSSFSEERLRLVRSERDGSGSRPSAARAWASWGGVRRAASRGRQASFFAVVFFGFVFCFFFVFVCLARTKTDRARASVRGGRGVLSLPRRARASSWGRSGLLASWVAVCCSHPHGLHCGDGARCCASVTPLARATHAKRTPWRVSRPSPCHCGRGGSADGAREGGGRRTTAMRRKFLPIRPRCGRVCD